MNKNHKYLYSKFFECDIFMFLLYFTALIKIITIFINTILLLLLLTIINWAQSTKYASYVLKKVQLCTHSLIFLPQIFYKTINS